MGVVHFAGLGKSPGAVSSGLAYLKHEMGLTFAGGKIVEALVIFTSEHVIYGTEEAHPAEFNAYMQRGALQKWPNRMTNALEIVTEFCQREFPDAALYLIQVDVNDFSVCFEKISKAILYFHRPGKVGKNIWANLTGGTNVLNMALLQAAYLSSFINRLYYTFVADIRQDGKYLQPFSPKESEFDFREIYVLPTTYDQRYSKLLQTLHDISDADEWIHSDDLLSLLKNEAADLFAMMDITTFAREYLNVMPGVETKQEGEHISVRINREGRNLLTVLELPWFQALLHQTPVSDDVVNDMLRDLNMKRLR